jgi:hypothetical protein
MTQSGSLEKSTAGVDINWLVLNQSPITLLWVLSSCMEKKSSCNRFPYLVNQDNHNSRYAMNRLFMLKCSTTSILAKAK